MEIFNFLALLQERDIDVSQYNDREKIEIFEYIMLQNFDNIAEELPIEEYLHGGIYERSLFIPAGVYLTGKIHLKDHIFYLLTGDLSVMTDDGMKRIQAPNRFNVKAGIKKLGYAHTNVLCTTFHRTDLTDLDEIEKELFYDSNLNWVARIMKSKELEATICQL